MKRVALLFGTVVVLAMSQAHAFVLVPDTNGDGKYSLDEVHAVMPEVSEADFRDADGDADGYLSPDELAAAQENGELSDHSTVGRAGQK